MFMQLTTVATNKYNKYLIIDESVHYFEVKLLMFSSENCGNPNHSYRAKVKPCNWLFCPNSVKHRDNPFMMIQNKEKQRLLN